MSNKYKFDWDKIKGKIKEEEAQSQSFGDSRIWRLKIDDNKKGSAIIRFLPDQHGTPYRQYFQHWFDYEAASGGVQKYVANCATTINMPCPICEKNRELWNSAYKADNDVARDRKRKVHYVSNILVLKDSDNTENEGKVFLYDFGPQIFGIVKKAMFGPEEGDPEYEEGVEVNTFIPCDLYDGADFWVRSTVKKGTEKAKRVWNTYEASKFKDQSRIFDDLDDVEWDEKVEAIMEQTHTLDEWTKPDKFPFESEVRSKLSYILGTTPQAEVEKDDIPYVNEEPEPDDAPGDVAEPDTTGGKTEGEVMSDEDYLNSVLNDKE